MAVASLTNLFLIHNHRHVAFYSKKYIGCNESYTNKIRFLDASLAIFLYQTKNIKRFVNDGYWILDAA